MTAEDIKKMLDAAQPDTLKENPLDEEDSEILYRRLDKVITKPIDWLWPKRIARGKVTIIAGHPGLGKSQACINIAAIVSNGAHFPISDSKCDIGNVIFLSAEDSAEDTIKPRLTAAGADLTHVYIVDAVKKIIRGATTFRELDLKKDIQRIKKFLQAIKNTSLIIIDPITAYLGNIDSHKNADVRALLTLLSTLASEENVAIIAVSHLSKSSKGDAIERVSGSMAFVAAARASYLITKDKDDLARRFFVPLKNNLGNDTTGYSFTIKEVLLPDGIETSTIEWSNQIVTKTANELMAAPAPEEEQGPIADAKKFLSDLLASDPIPQRHVKDKAVDEGISEKTLYRAKKELGIDSYKEGMKGGWFWSFCKAPPIKR